VISYYASAANTKDRVLKRRGEFYATISPLPPVCDTLRGEYAHKPVVIRGFGALATINTLTHSHQPFQQLSKYELTRTTV